MISDRQNTYTVFTYECDQVLWGSPLDILGSIFAVIGFNGAGFFANLSPFSGTSIVRDVDCQFINCGSPPVSVVYTIGSTNLPIGSCFDRITADETEVGTPSVFNDMSSMADCPCTLPQAQADVLYISANNALSNYTCYYGPNLGSISAYNGTQYIRAVCCYDR